MKRMPVFTANMAHCGNDDCRGVVHVTPEHGYRVKCAQCGAEGHVEVAPGPGDPEFAGNYEVVWTVL
ncbi:hypothetical protein LCGC14_0983340 [marine sediment metagenome]|uniref:Uncharacterized protein n=1 Tax=marine sediment metagenome TaxID=412755 RepID=A0A0F9N7X0_9ZZZZ